MRTLNIQQAAKLLHMSPGALREKAKAGLVKAAKPGKRWVFLETDLVDYLKALYSARGQAPLSGCEQEATLCHSTNAEIPTGSVSRRRTDSEYASLLGLKTGNRPRNTKID